MVTRSYNVHALAQYFELIAEKTGKNRKELGEFLRFPRVYAFLKSPTTDSPVSLSAEWVWIIHDCLGIPLETIYRKLYDVSKIGCHFYVDPKKNSRNFLSQRRTELIDSIKKQLGELEKQELLSD